jgi:twinkle protein
MELSELKRALADRAEEVCRLLLPGGKIDGKEWVCGDLGGGEGKSLKVVIRGDRTGVWKDFAGTAGGSNLLELWIQVRNVEFVDALNQAKEWLGTHGVIGRSAVRPVQKKAYAKPSTKGITWIANKAEFYLANTRRISREVIDLYKVSMTEDEQAIAFPYLNEKTAKAEMIKFLKLERDSDGKKQTWTSKDTPKVLYGKHTRRASDRFLVITEGEIDAMSWRCLDIPSLACNSVPFGAKWESKDGRDPNDEWIENDWDYLHSFERIYLSFDMDEEGRKAEASIIKRLGREICFVISLPAKDANELWAAGKSEELVAAFEAAKTLDPECLKNAGAYKQRVLDEMFSGDPKAKRGIPLPFGNYPFHFRWNEWTCVTGINGSGKTQLIGFILVYLQSLGYHSCVGSFEVRPERSIRYYVSQVTGVKDPDRALAERALEWLAGGFWMYDHVGEVSWREVLSAFRYAYRRYGVRFFVIDSWMKMGIAGDDYEAQGECCNAIGTFVDECDVHVFVVAHPRKVKNESESVGKMDIKGSGEITDQAHNVWTVWRNKSKEKAIEKMEKMKEPEERILKERRGKPDAILSVNKQRNDDGDEPTIDLYFQKESKQYFASYRDKGISFLEPKSDSAQAELQVTAPTEEIEEDAPF